MKQEIEKSFESIAELLAAFKGVGCDEVLVKPLATNQDNEKNQIYLGKNMTMASYLPGSVSLRAPSSSAAKHLSNPGKPIVSLQLDFYWLWPGGISSAAPNASIIEYSQYPEVRLSGFSSSGAKSPNALRRDFQERYGRRYLVLGISEAKVFGSVVTEVGEPETVREFDYLPSWPLQPLLKVLDSGSNGIDEARLIDEVQEICGRVHKPQVLKTEAHAPEEIAPISQAGGWTLEALLGIPRNSRSGPDKYGFEIKSVGSTRTSIITPEPDLGYRAEAGVSAFLAKYGKTAKTDPEKLVFNGLQRCGQPNSTTGTFLTIENWDFATNSPTGHGQPNVLLVDKGSEVVVAGWSFAKLASSWTKKHAGALYLEAKKVKLTSGKVQGYQFGPIGLLGKGTSPLLLLTQIARGQVFLDPGDSKRPDSPAKSRTQWRVNGDIAGQLAINLKPLYRELEILGF